MDDPVAIRQLYEQHGAREYYEKFGAEYRNPHEPVICEALREAVRRWRPDLSRVLDLACGSGEATLALEALGAKEIDGVDPFTQEAYLARTGRPAAGHRFEEIAAGALAGRAYSLIVCSFAMHLVEISWLPALLAQLRTLSDRLLILTPHKRPEIRPEWGWRIEDEFIHERVRARFYRAG
ncbi:MAG: class I SAM-dependent methyltransferase [Blastocatellia bacterium]|nr:class I SAM-dependent methyltransferase [Blastocatellia bacterium]